MFGVLWCWFVAFDAVAVLFGGDMLAIVLM